MAAYTYDAASAGALALSAHPAAGATFASDAIPAEIDEIQDLGWIGFGVAGYAPCPEAYADASGPQVLPANTQGGDREYLVLAAPDLLTAADALADQIRARDATVGLVSAASVATHYGGGTLTDTAVRSWLRSWLDSASVLPYFLLFVGDVDGVGGAGVLPTHIESAPTPWLGSYEYPCDAWFADAELEDRRFREVLIGRLPAERSYEVFRYITKLRAYENEADAPVREQLLMVVGDNTGTPAGFHNQQFTVLADNLWDGALSEWFSKDAIYTSDYAGTGHFDEPAEVEFVERVSEGRGVVVGIGNSYDDRFMHYCSWSSHTIGEYGTLERLLPGSPAWLLLSNTCLVGRFHSASSPGEHRGSVGERLLLGSGDRGPVAVLAASHLVPAARGAALQTPLVEALVRSNIPVGALDAHSRAHYGGAVRRAEDYVVRQQVLLGDPSLAVGGAEARGVEWNSGAEIHEPLLEQRQPVSYSNAVVGFARVVRRGEPGIPAPASGDRALRLQAGVVQGAGSAKAEWRIAKPNRTIAKGQVLRYRAYCSDAPNGVGRVGIDGVLDDGRRLSEIAGIMDQEGVALGYAGRNEGPGWTTRIVRLDTVSGHTLTELRAGFDVSAASGGTVRCYFDDIGVGWPTELDAGNRVVNGAMEDFCGDSTIPDGWTVFGEDVVADGTRNTVHSGGYALGMTVKCGAVGGVEQILHTSGGTENCILRLWYRGACTSEVTVANAASGAILGTATAPISSSWQLFTMSFALSAAERVRLRVRPTNCAIPVRIDDVSVRDDVVVDVAPPTSLPTEGPGARLDIWGSPGASAADITVRLVGGDGAPLHVSLFDAAGRELAKSRTLKGSSSGAEMRLVELFDISRFGAGVYFVRCVELNRSARVVLVR
ncbi:MAG: hypothetical protein IT349_20625 [Candidatus Eisenbacteria bacterium]|nr:hypothetical protein [Candidatus Eisenbacteria bacterium]